MKTTPSVRSMRILAMIGVGGFLAFTAVSLALATESNTTNPNPGTAVSSSNFGIAGKSWTSIAAEEFATLPKGTAIVDCSPNQKRLPAGANFETSGAYMQMHPGLYFLSDGTCALDPNATLIPMRQDNVDPKVP